MTTDDRSRYMAQPIDSIDNTHESPSDELGAAEAVSALIDILQNENEFVRRDATNALRKLGPVAKDAVPDLIQIIRHDNSAFVRDGALSALAKIEPKDAVEYLIIALHDDDAQVRMASARELSGIGMAAGNRKLARIGPAKDAVPALAATLQHDKNKYVRWAAAEALRFISPAAEEIGPTLYAALHDEDHQVRSMVAKILAEIGSDGIAAFVKASRDELEGIEVLGDEAVLAQDALNTFRRLGEICKEHDTNVFTFIAIKDILNIPKSTIQNHIDICGNLFRQYFKKFEYKTDIPLDTDKGFAKEHKLFDRGKGKRSTMICHPRGCGVGIGMPVS